MILQVAQMTSQSQAKAVIESGATEATLYRLWLTLATTLMNNQLGTARQAVGFIHAVFEEQGVALGSPLAELAGYYFGSAWLAAAVDWERFESP